MAIPPLANQAESACDQRSRPPLSLRLTHRPRASQNASAAAAFPGMCGEVRRVSPPLQDLPS